MSAVLFLVTIIFAPGVGSVSLVGLSRVLKVVRESTSASARLTATAVESEATTWEATTAAASKGAATAHHGEENLGVNAAVHAAATAEHVSRILQVNAAVITLTLPIMLLANKLGCQIPG